VSVANSGANQNAAEYKPHSLTETYPEMDKPAFGELVESVRQFGIRCPVVMLNDEILDGRNRWKAARLANVEIPTVQYEGNRDFNSLNAFVVSMNETRRHLTPSQRAIRAVKLTELAAKTKREVGSRKPALTLSEAAKIEGVSERSVDHASKVVQRGAAEVVKAVEVGDVSVKDAAAIANLSTEDQIEALTSVIQGRAPTLRKAIGPKARKRKNGVETLPAAKRRDVKKKFGIFLRALDSIGIGEVCRPHMTKVLEIINSA
jgi:ParB-like chromosome segregation protein Spo0J